jgi:hypothetical protein
VVLKRLPSASRKASGANGRERRERTQAQEIPVKIYPEFLQAALRDDLLANHTFFEPAQFAYLLESFAEHYLRQRPVDLLEVTLDPAFSRELLASSVDSHLIAPKVASRLAQRLGRKLQMYVMDRGGLGLGMEEVGLGPGDWRHVTDKPLDGDLVVHFLDNDRVVYSRPFEGEIVFAAGKSVRSRFLGRTLLKRYGELYVIYQDVAEPAVLQALNDLEIRIAPDRDQRLFLDVEPSGRHDEVRLGERVALCQLGVDHRLGLIVTPRGQDPAPPRVESLWVGISVEGMLEAQAVVREEFELKHNRIAAQLVPRQGEGEPVAFVLELQSRRDALQVFRGRVEPADLLETEALVDVRLSAQNRSGFRLESTGTGIATLRLRPLLVPEPLSPPPFLTPAALERGLSLAFAVPEETGAGKRFTLHCRQERELYDVGPVSASADRVVFSVPPLEPADPESPISLWLTCEDPAVPLASHGNGPEEPLLVLPVYAIAPGGRPITGGENFLFADEVLLFGAERLRVVRWGRAVAFPSPEAYPYFLWRTRERPPLRLFLRDGRLVTEAGAPVQRLVFGSGRSWAPEPGPGGELSVSTQCSGRAAYLAVQLDETGSPEVRKAAGRIHDVALDFEPLGSSAPLPQGGALLLAGTALFGVRCDRENLEVSLLGHFLGEDELERGVRIGSEPDAADSSGPWIHVAADRPLAVTLSRE